jgi:hypothetical protein
MAPQENVATLIDCGLDCGDIQIRVARSHHDVPCRFGSTIGSPAWLGEAGGANHDQQRNDSHVGMMRPGGIENK